MYSQSILLVEDNPDDVLLTRRALQKNNIFNKLIVAQDGVEALKYLSPAGIQTDRAFQDLPSIILLDLKLPRINGLEVLRRIRSQEHTRFIPVIILTSSQEEEDILQTYNNGANS